MLLILGATLGLAGGIIRAVFGLIKKPPNDGISYKRLIVVLTAAGAIGLFATIFVPNDLKFSLLAGYGGTDFIEGLWKIKLKDIKF